MPAPEPRLWVVDTPNTSYVVALDAEDRLHGLHWGPKLDREQASELEPPNTVRHPIGDDQVLALDLNPASAFRYGQTGLQVRFGDGTRELELRFSEASETGGSLDLVFIDSHYPLEVRVRYRALQDTDVIERSTALRNTGAEPIEIVRADSATWVLPRLEDYRLSQLHGEWGSEFQLTRTALPYGETLIGSRRGFTGHHSNPWTAIDDGTATESLGAVWSTNLAWSGSWRTTVERYSNDRVTVSAGFGHDPVTFRLGAGESLETPIAAGVYTEGGFSASASAWHDYALGHVLPTPRRTGRSSTTRGRRPRSTSTSTPRSRLPRRPRPWAASCSSWTTPGSARGPATGPGSGTGGPTPTGSPTGSAR
ncbi:hypothetical protein GCM10029992_27220 [Glycomyces albus]